MPNGYDPIVRGLECESCTYMRPTEFMDNWGILSEKGEDAPIDEFMKRGTPIPRYSVGDLVKKLRERNYPSQLGSDEDIQKAIRDLRRGTMHISVVGGRCSYHNFDLPHVAGVVCPDYSLGATTEWTRENHSNVLRQLEKGFVYDISPRDSKHRPNPESPEWIMIPEMDSAVFRKKYPFQLANPNESKHE